MRSHYWIKLYHEILDDPKMGRLNDHLWRRTIELFLLAGEENDGGALPSLSDMAWRLRLSEDTLLAELHDLSQIGIVVQRDDDTWFVAHFAQRQARMSNAERQQRYRDRKHRATYYNNDTPNGIAREPVTQCSTDEETDTDLDEDGDQDVPDPTAECPPSRHSAKASKPGPFALYEQATACTLSPIVADRIRELIDECEQHRLGLPPPAAGAASDGGTWVCQAIEEATRSTNHINLNYVAAILDRWRQDGFQAPFRTRANRHSATTDQKWDSIDEWANANTRTMHSAAAS